MGWEDTWIAQEDAAGHAQMIREDGNKIPLSTGGFVTAITDDKWDSMRKVVGQAYLDEAVGRVALFTMTPADAKKIAAKPSALLNWQGEQFTAHPAESLTVSNVPLYVTLVGHSITNLFPHRCDIYTQSATVDQVTGRGQAPTWALKEADVACYYLLTINIDTPTVAGRAKEASIFTRDTVFFGYSSSVGNGDALVNKTTLPDGTASKNFGEIELIQGAPKRTAATLLLPYGKQEVQAMTDENPPAALVAIAKAMPHTGSGYWD